MIQNDNVTASSVLPLEDFGKLQQRYQAMTLAERAKRVLADAEPALALAEQILTALEKNTESKQAIDNLRKNIVLTGKMRASEAKNALLDGESDFIDITRHKLAVWRKTVERLGSGEGIMKDKTGEYIAGHMPIAVALGGIGAASGYLSIIQLVIGDLAKADGGNAGRYLIDLAKVRRCATCLSDCELASCISTLVH